MARGRLAWVGVLGFATAALAAIAGPKIGALLFAVPVAAAVVLRATRDIVWLVSIYLVVLTLIPARLTLPGLGGAATPANALATLLMLLWIALRWIPGFGFDRARRPVRSAIVAFQWVSLLGLAVALSRPLAEIEANNALKGVLQVIGLGGVALCVADGVSSRARLDALLKRLVLLLTILALVGIGAFFTGFDLGGRLTVPGLESVVPGPLEIEMRSTFRRVAATAEHPIELALLLTVGLPLACHYARFAPSHRRRRWWTAAAVFGVAIPMSVSRTAVLALAIGTAVVVPSWTRRERRTALMVSIVFAGAMKLMVPGLLGTLRALVLHAGDDLSVSGRITDYEVVGDYLAEAPLLGRGINTFEPRLYAFLDNQYLKTALEGGVIGFGALVAVFVVASVCASGVEHLADDAETRDLARSLLATVLMIMASFATFDLLSFDISTGVLFVLIGVIGALWRQAHEQQHTASQTGPTVG